jgi:hypothetical protein
MSFGKAEILQMQIKADLLFFCVCNVNFPRLLKAYADSKTTYSYSNIWNKKIVTSLEYTSNKYSRMGILILCSKQAGLCSFNFNFQTV